MAVREFSDGLQAAGLSDLEALGRRLLDRLRADDPAAIPAGLGMDGPGPGDRLRADDLAVLKRLGRGLVDRIGAADVADLLSILEVPGRKSADRIGADELAAIKAVGQELIDRLQAGDLASIPASALMALGRERADEIEPADLTAVRALLRAIDDRLEARELPRLFVVQKLIARLRTSDLRGMGGAGRPAFSKWSEGHDEAGRADATFVLCNGDESEPSTFKDRELLLRAPHLVVEGMVLGALVVGARRGYVYIRHEYADQVAAVEAGIERAREIGAVGPDVLGTGRPFELEVFESPGGYIGEIGALSDLPELGDLAPAGVRTATCTALDHVDLVRIPTEAFRRLLDEYPAVKALVVEEARRRLESDRRPSFEPAGGRLDAFLDQGLMNANSLLVLDLEKCTRCDECTRACSDAHQGVTRLIREGQRFDKYLVASSCRSCLDPYCLVGCPVGSITRSPRGEIRIADWCIGCTLCAQNCPYGNINMVEQDNRARTARVLRATTCDLCRSLGPDEEWRCVYACPHDAAHRMSGPSLLEMVRGREG